MLYSILPRCATVNVALLYPVNKPKPLWQIFVQIENHKAAVPSLRTLEVSAMSHWDALNAVESDIQSLTKDGDPSILAIHRVTV